MRDASDNRFRLYLRDLGMLLRDRAIEARAGDASELQSGRLVAYYEVLSTLKGTAEAFGISAGDLSLADFDPDKELLSKPSS